MFNSRSLNVTLMLLGLALWSPVHDAHAENDQVIIVPYSQQNPQLPHPAHEGAPITLKAIIRNAQCNSYEIRWGINRNGNYDDDHGFTASRHNSTQTVRDIGRGFVVPYVDRDKSLNINVRARSNCGGGDKFGTFKLFVYNFGENGQGAERLSLDPRQWTKEQREILVSMAIQENLWHTHRDMHSGSLSGRNVVGIEGHAGYSHSTGIGLWLFVINNHFPAYPPNTIPANDPGPDGWVQENARRWNVDPYAESAIRLLNYMVARSRVAAVDAADESNTRGYIGRGARTQNRIPGTNDRAGIYTSNSYNVYIQGMNTGGISAVLPSLAGTRVKVGPAAGQQWNWYVQQLVDYLGYQQIDNAGCPHGGWYYRAISSTHCRYSDLSTTQWAYIGLETAEVVGDPYGVFVNNRHKYRIADNLINNQQGDGGAAYDNTGRYRSDVKLTGGQILAARWLDTHNMSTNSNAVPFPNEANRSYSTLRRSHDRYLNFVRDWFTRRRVYGSLNWLDGLWQHGDYLCGNTNTIYNAGRCANTYSLYSHQKAYHTGTPELHHIGPHDWYQMFSTYYIRAMDRYARNNDARWNYDINGRIRDDYCETTSPTCRWGNGQMSSIMGGLVLTPAVFNPKPVAQGSASTDRVTEGCVPGNGVVEFSHGESFHPNGDAEIVIYAWDVDDSDGLWWETGANPDLDINGDPLRTGDKLESLSYVYRRRGTYTPTLRVEDDGGLYKTMKLGAITVDAAADVPPSIATGGPYVIEVGDNLQLDGSASDGNSACGDRTTVRWNIDYSLENPNNRTFETAGEKARVNWVNGGVLDRLPENEAITIQVQVSDQFNGNNESPIEQTTLFIYNKNPVVEARVNPAQAACRQEVTFDASDSYHPNPRRTISSYQWEVDGRTSDRAIFTTNFNSFGPRDARVTVTDDLGRSSEKVVTVNVNQGNLPPTIRVARDQITVMSNATIVLDARQSSDPNADCGDRIVAYEWDMLADGLRINGAAGADYTGAQVEVPVADWHTAMNWDANDELLIRLTARDAQGATSTRDITVRAVRAEPIPAIEQVPDPASFAGGRLSSVRLDGRESASLLDGVTISRYEWDVGCDGTYEREQGQFLYERTFPEGTTAADIANNPVVVCLRVTDSNGNVAVSAPYAIRYEELGNTPPTADADPSGAPETGYNILEGEGVTLDASSSFDPDSADFDDHIREFAWTLNGQSGGALTKVAANEDAVAAAQTVTLDPAALAGLGVEARGEYAISLRVSDTSGNQGTDTSTLTIHRASPEITAVINPVNASPNSRITFDASRSDHTHPDIEVNQVIWFFGELEVVGGACDSDDDCARGYCIENPSNNDALTCMDGSLGSQEGEVVNRTFDTITPDEGDAIQVVVVVRDTNGGQSQSSSDGDFNEGEDGNDTRFGISVDQGNRLPVANPGGGTGVDGDDVVGAYTLMNDPNQTIAFDGSSSVDPDAEFGDEITSYTWTIGTCVCSTNAGAHNNCPVAQNQVSETLPELTLAQLAQCQIQGEGSYDVTLTVTDRFGQDASTTTSLNVVSGLVAFAQANPNRTGCEQIVDFDGRGSSFSGPAEQGFNIVSYEWDIDGDGVTDFENPTFSIPVTAQPTGNPPAVRLSARLTVTNAIGAALIAAGEDPGPHQSQDDITVVIDVQNLPPVANAGGPYRTGGNNGNFAPVTVDGRGSIDPNEPCDSLAEYWWDTDGDELYGCEDNNGPVTINGRQCDYVGPVVSFANPSWQPNTTASVGLKVRDQFGVWSQPNTADIIVDNVIPPSGEVLSPRVGVCAVPNGDGTASASILVRHPAPQPQPVIVKIMVAGQEVASQRVANFNANKEAQVAMRMNLAQLPEGNHEIVASFTLENNVNSTTNANSGGRVTFDFTGPAITVGAQPAEGVCYVNGRVPDSSVEVEDNIDNAPQVSERVEEAGCGRSLVVNARDFCGNETSVTRDYLVGTAVNLDVAGVTDELMPSAQVTWEIDGPEACARDIEASLSRDGGAGVPYAENAAVNTPGEYALTLTVWNCTGTPRDQVVNFRVNRPPVARPQPDGHPSADPNGVNAYIVAEGSPLTIDGTASTAPEFDDSIASYTWTFRGAELDGPTPTLNTSEDGVFNGSLEVTDGLGATHTESFQVTITDIDPVINPGGPYVADQGETLTFDASRSRSLSPDSDPIRSYTWAWGDGTADSNGAVVDHTFTAQGAYNVTLTVCDEDSCSSTPVGVVIADVDPEIESIYITDVMGEANNDRPDPVLGYEIVPVTFGVTATPGAPNDPITLYQWDFDGDQVFEETTNDPSVVWQFMEPGVYLVGVLARDRDSFTFRTQVVDVHTVSYETTLRYAKVRLEEVLAGDLNIINRARLANTGAKIDAALWGQRTDGFTSDINAEYNEGDLDQPSADRTDRVHLNGQGVSFNATKSVLSDFILAQRNGADFSTAIWSLSRQLRRELELDLAAVSNDTEGAYADRQNDPVYARRLGVSTSHLRDVITLFNDESFERDARDLNRTAGLALDLQEDASRGLGWLSVAVDQCADPRFNSFLVEESTTNPAAYSVEANIVRASAYEALSEMKREMENFAARGGENDPAPGRDRILDAVANLEVILERAELNISFDCRQNCSGNENALLLELEAMEMIAALQAAGAAGAYVLPWQSCLVEFLRFRIEASLVQVRAQCGQFNPLYLKAEEIFGEGEALLTENDDIIGALNFYSDDAQRCLVLDVYNKCLVKVDPNTDFYPYPQACLD